MGSFEKFTEAVAVIGQKTESLEDVMGLMMHECAAVEDNSKVIMDLSTRLVGDLELKQKHPMAIVESVQASYELLNSKKRWLEEGLRKLDEKVNFVKGVLKEVEEGQVQSKVMSDSMDQQLKKLADKEKQFQHICDAQKLTLRDVAEKKNELYLMEKALNGKKDEIESRQKELEARELEVCAKEEMLDKRQQEMDSEKASLGERESMMAFKEMILVESEHEISLKHKALNGRNDEIHSRQKELEARELELRAKEDVLEKRQQKMDSEKKRLDNELESRKASLSERESAISFKQMTLVEREHEISLKQKDLSRRKDEIESRQIELEAKELEVCAEEEMLSKRQQEMDAEKKRLDSELESRKASSLGERESVIAFKERTLVEREHEISVKQTKLEIDFDSVNACLAKRESIIVSKERGLGKRESEIAFKSYETLLDKSLRRDGKRQCFGDGLTQPVKAPSHPQNSGSNVNLDSETCGAGGKFNVGDVWSCFGLKDALPRSQVQVIGIDNMDGKDLLKVKWLKPCPVYGGEKEWIDAGLPVSCGKFYCSGVDILPPRNLCHQVFCVGESPWIIRPCEGETWALYKDWDIRTWSLNPKIHRNCKYNIVEILSYHPDGVRFAYLNKIKGCLNLFQRISYNHSVVMQTCLYRFSHRVPSVKKDCVDANGTLRTHLN